MTIKTRSGAVSEDCSGISASGDCRHSLARGIARRATPALAGAGLLLSGAAQAATFTPTTPAELITAINTANANGEVDTIELGGNSFTLTTVDNTTNGPNGLPSILSDGGNALTVQNGTIERATTGSPPAFRFFHLAAGADLTLNQLTLQNGSTAGSGGGIYNLGTATLAQSKLSGNTATTNGGGIYNSGTATLTHSTLSGNSAVCGGGVFNRSGTVTISDSTLSGNSAGTTGTYGADDGGGIWNEGTLNLTDSTLSVNAAGGEGGGILNLNTANITNSTLSGNIAGAEGGGLYNKSGMSLSGTSVLNHVTIANNTASLTGGGLSANGGTINLIDSLVVDNIATSQSDPQQINNCRNALVVVPSSASGANYADDSGCDGVTYSATADQIGPLADNGGPTQTHALCTAAGVPVHTCSDSNYAIDKATSSTIASDQRGVARPIGSNRDSGAFETGAELDFGDAPDDGPPGFPTLITSNGAAHQTNNPAGAGPFFGTMPDSDDGTSQQNADASADDISGAADDEDVDLSGGLVIGATNTVPVTISGSGLVNAWVDLNADGDWDDTGEQVLTDASVTGATASLAIPIPATATAGDTFARLRISDGSATTPTGITPRGLLDDGEVEDHPVTLVQNEVSIGNVMQAEGDSGTSTFGFPLTLLAPPLSDVTVSFDTADGSAMTGDNDFVGVTGGSATISAGSASGTADVTVNGENVFEGNETFEVTLTGVTSGAAVLGTTMATGTIQDDDPVTVMFNPTGDLGSFVNVPENATPAGPESISAGVVLSNPSSEPIEVQITVDGASTADNGVDFNFSPTTLTFAPDETEKDLMVEIIDDGTVEADETAIFNLAVTTGTATAGGPFTATIIDNDEEEIIDDDDDDDDDCSAFEYLIFCIGSGAASPADLAVLLPLALIGLWRRQRRRGQ